MVFPSLSRNSGLPLSYVLQTRRWRLREVKGCARDEEEFEWSPDSGSDMLHTTSSQGRACCGSFMSLQCQAWGYLCFQLVPSSLWTPVGAAIPMGCRPIGSIWGWDPLGSATSDGSGMFLCPMSPVCPMLTQQQTLPDNEPWKWGLVASPTGR